MFVSLLLALASPLVAQDAPPPYAMPGEEPVDPYKASPANAGATPFRGDGMARAFGGKAGIQRIVDRFVTTNFADAKIGEIFTNHDQVRLRRVLFEQFCYILNAGCVYTGRDMASSHKDMGVKQGDMNKLVENLQAAMKAERVPFAAQNKFLAKLAPMRGHVVGQ